MPVNSQNGPLWVAAPFLLVIYFIDQPSKQYYVRGTTALDSFLLSSEGLTEFLALRGKG